MPQNPPPKRKRQANRAVTVRAVHRKTPDLKQLRRAILQQAIEESNCSRPSIELSSNHMNCPKCQKEMQARGDDLSRDRQRGIIYERVRYVCKDDDIWLTVETPIAKTDPTASVEESQLAQTAAAQSSDDS